MKAIFDHKEALTETITTFWFKPERAMRFTAGQFTELTLPHDNPDDRGTSRWFTLSSSPNNELASITTRFFGNEASTFKKALFALEPGAEVSLEEAMGDFVLPKSADVPVILVAGGIGITPMHSMLAWLKGSGEKRNVRLLWSVRTEDDIIFQNIIDASGVHATIVVTEPSPSWGGERGRLTAQTILGLESITADTLVYLSGPEPMLEALEKDLLATGLPKQQIVTDFFPGYTNL